MSDLSKARGLNSIADPRQFKGAPGRGRAGRRTPPSPEPPEPAEPEIFLDEEPPATNDQRLARAGSDPTDPREGTTTSRTTRTRRTRARRTASSGRATDPADSATSDLDTVGPDAFDTTTPASARTGTSNRTAAPDDTSSPSDRALADDRANRDRTATSDEGRAVSSGRRTPAPAPPPERRAAAPHRAVTPGIQRKRRELSIPHELAEALDATRINPADVVMAGYRRHADAIYAGEGGRLMARAAPAFASRSPTSSSISSPAWAKPGAGIAPRPCRSSSPWNCCRPPDARLHGLV